METMVATRSRRVRPCGEPPGREDEHEETRDDDRRERLSGVDPCPPEVRAEEPAVQPLVAQRVVARVGVDEIQVQEMRGPQDLRKTQAMRNGRKNGNR